MAKFIPGIGEIYTCLESAVLISSAGLAKVCGDDKAASELADSAGNAWKEYKETNLIAAPINLAVQENKGNRAEVRRLEQKFGNAASAVADGLPVVGHVKGVVHYAMGDKQKGHQSMESASRTTLVLGAGALTGGLGAGVALGAGAGVGTGLAYDGTTTLIDKAVSKDPNTANNRGIFALANKDVTPNEVFGALVTPIGDGLTGAGGAKLGKNIRARVNGQSALKNTFKEIKVADPKGATKQTMNAAKAGRKAQNLLKKNDLVVTSQAVDGASGKSGVGQNGNYRNAIAKQNGQPKTNYKTTASKSHLQTTYPEVKPDPSVKWGQSNCAEHAAFDQLSDCAPNYKPENVTTATVKTLRSGLAVTMERCGNCKNFIRGMGRVVTDMIPNGTSVPTCGYVSGGSLGAAAALAVGGTRVKSQQVYCSCLN